MHEVLTLLVGVGRPDQESPAEALREVDDVLAPLDRVERQGQLPERLEELADPAPRVLVVAHLVDDRQRLQAVGETRLVRAGRRSDGASDPGRGRSRGLVEGEGERIAPLPRRLEAERLDGAGELDAVGGESDEHAHALLDGVRGDRGEVAVTHPRENEFLRRAARQQDGTRLREGEVEEEQEPAAGGRIERRRDTRGRLLRKVDRVEADDRLTPPVVFDREVGGGQPADGVSVAAHDPHGDLDERDLRALADGPGLLGAAGRRCTEEDREDGDGKGSHGLEPGAIISRRASGERLQQFLDVLGVGSVGVQLEGLLEVRAGFRILLQLHVADSSVTVRVGVVA